MIMNNTGVNQFEVDDKLLIVNCFKKICDPNIISYFVVVSQFNTRKYTSLHTLSFFLRKSCLKKLKSGHVHIIYTHSRIILFFTHLILRKSIN